MPIPSATDPWNEGDAAPRISSVFAAFPIDANDTKPSFNPPSITSAPVGRNVS